MLRLFVWGRDRRNWAQLAYAVVAAAVAGVAACELAMVRAQTTAQCEPAQG